MGGRRLLGRCYFFGARAFLLVCARLLRFAALMCLLAFAFDL
jgi:hypothetical protein